MKVYAVIISLCFIIQVDYIAPQEYTSLFTICDCSLQNQSGTDWSLFDEIAVANMNEYSVISSLVGFNEDFCIVSCQENVMCKAVQVNITEGDGSWCKLLSFTPSMGKVRNQTGSKLLLKGRNTLVVCDGLLGCYSLQVDGHLYVILADRHYDNIFDARNTCLDMPTLTGEFDLAIMDTWPKIMALRAFLSGLPNSNDIRLYIGGEAGLEVSDPTNKWTRTGVAITQTLWYWGEPNSPHEMCVLITETYNGLVDSLCTGRHNGPAKDINTLCEYFPGK